MKKTNNEQKLSIKLPANKLPLTMILLLSVLVFNLSVFGSVWHSLPARPVRLSASSQYAAATTIGASQTIELFKRNESEGAAFEVVGMLPGDSYTQNYNVRIHHDDALTVTFDAVVKDTGGLDEVLLIKVELDSDTVVYDGTLKNARNIKLPAPKPKNGITELVCSVTASLSETAGNEWQKNNVKADFKWSVEEKKSLTTSRKQKVFFGIVGGVVVVSIGSMLFMGLRAAKRK